MKITSIKQQAKRANRYSVFVDGRYEFSLSDTALLESKLTTGQELNQGQVRELKKLSSEDKLLNLTLTFVAMRPRTKWEIEKYLERKKASPALATTILNKLSNIDLIDDSKFARVFINDRRLLRPTSRRKMIMDLRKVHVPSEVIEAVMGHDSDSELTALQSIIARKRKQTRYQDDLKLMQYLARQGFTYNDIKAALHDDPIG